MSDFLVGLDVDGVLYRWGRAVRHALRDKFGIDVDAEKWFAREDVTLKQWEWVWSDASVAQIFGTGESFPGSISFARELCRLYPVRILTACPEAAVEPRIRWLRTRGVHYSEFSWVHPPKIRGAVGTDGVSHASKSSVLPHCDVYIDDNSNNCDELMRNTNATVILVDHSWNRGELAPQHPRVLRAFDFDQILKEVARVKHT